MSDEKWRLFKFFFSRVRLKTYQHPFTYQQHSYGTFWPCGMWCRVSGWVVPHILKEHNLQGQSVQSFLDQTDWLRKWRGCVSSKHLGTLIQRHIVTPQKTWDFTDTALRTSALNSTILCVFLCVHCDSPVSFRDFESFSTCTFDQGQTVLKLHGFCNS